MPQVVINIFYDPVINSILYKNTTYAIFLFQIPPSKIFLRRANLHFT